MMESKSEVVEVADKPTAISRLKRMIIADVDKALLGDDTGGRVFVTWQITTEESKDAIPVEQVKIGRSSYFISKQVEDSQEAPEPIGHSEREADKEADVEADKEAHREHLNKKTVPEIKKEMDKAGLDTDGKKDVLIERLVEHESEVQD